MSTLQLQDSPSSGDARALCQVSRLDREARYREALSQPQAAVNDTGTDTFAATSLWLDRTQWPSIYRGSRRDVLRALIRLPNRPSLNADYTLGQGNSEGAPNLVSLREDAQKILCIMRALDLVIDRCEETSYQEIAFNLIVERKTINVKIKPEISAQLDQIWEHNIWNYIDVSKGIWLAVERQETCQGSDGKEDAEDDEIDDENVEAWELEDDEDDESDYDDSGYYNDVEECAAGAHQDPFSRVSGDSAASAVGQFLELLFQLCIMLSTEPFLDGQLSSMLLIYFSGILGFSADCQKFQLARQYCSKLSAMMHFECFDKVRAKMEEQLAGGLYTACGQTLRISELLSLEYENGPNISCGIYALGHVLFKYLVYVRHVADLLRREQLGADRSA
ncbi:uncharacterized protein BKA55DRAFT_599224 [Fusarium redolens]|uniref:Uncharacterized protein n=1 Tax=Fusarium redolens TaxID=48865 RepID=A0A9P9FZB0_FUSRE|nr:uncharacterized protein BKA55DRAFT_599224 [Fusarium redolens]KAH7227219.1 hypothetical protein BKA55DRAFT_599224 [Fusarium redolens]